MKKEFEVYYINKFNNTITFNTNFFERFFLYPPPNTDKPLASLSLRLGFVLLNKLSFSTPKNLPRRTILAEQLHATQQSIINSLIQLEEIGFIERYRDSNNRRFDTKFTLNFFYNMKAEEIIMLKEHVKYYYETNDNIDIDSIKHTIKHMINL